MVEIPDDVNFIDICAYCGKWKKDFHRCFPNNGHYSEEEWPKILEKRREMALVEAKSTIEKRKSEFRRNLIEQFVDDVDELRRDVISLRSEVIGILNIPYDEAASTRERVRQKKTGLEKVNSRLLKLRSCATVMMERFF